MHGLKKNLLIGGLAVCCTLATIFSPISAAAASAAQTESTTTSIYGYDQYETAAKIAQSGWGGTSDYAILAAGMPSNLIDALAAGPLAAKLDAPIILTEGYALNKSAKEQLTRLKVKKVYVTSGTAVIKQNVIDEVKGITTVTEVKALGGMNASETSVNIAKEMANQGVKISKVVVTGGAGSDALSIAPIAGAQGMPILYTSGGPLSSYVKTYLDGIKADLTKTYVIGGTSVLSEAAKMQIPGTVQRYSGQTQYDTNIEVLKQFAGVFKNKNTYVANGETLVDALAGAPLAARTNSPILLAGKQFPETSKKFAQSSLSPNVVGLGGESVVPASVLATLAPAEILSQEGSSKGSAHAASLEHIKGILKVTGKNVTVKNAKTNYSIYIQGDKATLNNVSVKGTVFVDPGKNGSATLQKVTAENIVILSGAQDSVRLEDVTANVLVVASSSNVHVEVTGTANITKTVVASSAIIDVIGGSLGMVEITNSSQTDSTAVELRGVFDTIVVNSPAKVSLADNSKITNVITNVKADLIVPPTATILNFDAKGTGTTPTGGGTVGAPSTVSIGNSWRPGNTNNSNDSNQDSGVVNNAQALLAAVASGNETITLGSNIDLGSSALDINRAITLNGNTHTITGNVSVNVTGTTLKNSTITGDLVLGEGIGDGDAIVEGVTVLGDTVVKGGGENSIHFTNSVLLTVIVNKNNGIIRIVVEGSTSVTEVQLETPTRIDASLLGHNAQGINNVTISEALQGTVQLLGNFETVNSRATNVRIQLDGATDIRTLVLNATATVFGDTWTGNINTAQINANGSTISQRPQNLVLDNQSSVRINSEVVNESYSNSTSASITSIEATQSSIKLRLNSFVADLTAADFVVSAALYDNSTQLNGSPVELEYLNFDNVRGRFSFKPLTLGPNLGKSLVISVAPSSTSTKVSGETKTATVIIANGFGGRITDVSNVGIEGAIIEFRNGTGTTSGDVVGQTTTGKFGYYSIALPAGMYTGEISGPGLVTSYMIANAPTDEYLPLQNETAIRAAGINEVKIMLTWGQNPQDEDSHLTGPGPFHTWYADKQYSVDGVVYADLDWDDTQSYGPETTTIRRLVDGVYRFYVHHYSGVGTLRESGATVKIFDSGSNTPSQTFNVPTGEGNERYWIVFEMQVSENGSNIVVNAINQMAYILKNELVAKIAEANQLIANMTVGEQPGNYPQAAKDALNNAVQTAQTVVDKVDATAQEVQNAELNLSNAISEFLEQRVLTPEEQANKDIAKALNLIPNALYPSEGADTNVLSMLNATVGISTTNVILGVESSDNTQVSATNGDITYGNSDVTANVLISIAKTNGTTVYKTVSIVIPAYQIPSSNLSITTNTLPNGTLGVSYSASITAMGGTSPYTYAVTSGTTPAGITLNATTGMLSGTATTPGAFTFTVRVTDYAGVTTSAAFNLNISSPLPPQLTLTGAALPNGTLGVNYSVSIAAMGGTSPYTYAVTSGTTPAGITLNAMSGMLSGTATTPGAFTFTIRVTDYAGATTSAAFNLNISTDEADVTAALTAISHADYTNLVVADVNDQSLKTQAVQAVVTAAVNNPTVTAIVSYTYGEYVVAISKNAAANSYNISTALFVVEP